MHDGGVKPPHSKALRAVWVAISRRTRAPHFFRIFCLTSPGTHDSLLLWSRWRHFVAVARRGAPMLTGTRHGTGERGNKGSENTKSNTNEASMLLKTQGDKQESSKRS